MPFEVKHFTPEQLAKLSVLNPTLYQDMGFEQSDPDADLLEALQLNAITWAKLEAAYRDEQKAYEQYVKAKKGKPLFEKGEILAMILLFCLFMVLI